MNALVCQTQERPFQCRIDNRLHEQFLACAWDRSKQLSQLPSRVRVGWDGSGGFSIAARCDIRTMAGH